jgi:hypothetical protein
MKSRPRIFLVLSVVLLALAACTAPQPRPGDIPREEPPGPAEAPEQRVALPTELAELPYGSMAEIVAATREVSAYRPDEVMAILRSLGPLSSTQLAEAIDARAYDAEFTEWLELDLLLRRVLANEAPAAEVARQWERFHYGHVITASAFSDLAGRLGEQYPAPLQVAILLPEAGGLSAAGRAIRDGIISAYLERPGESTLHFYATRRDQASAIQAYHQAQQDGATQVIGPLRAESTRALAGLDEHPVPLLLLNDPGTEPAEQPGGVAMINSLTMSQTEETRAAAAQLLGQGLTRAMVFAPDNTWGQRIEAAFVSAFTAGGGQVVAGARFDPASSDHSDLLTGLLKIDESTQRKQGLQSRLGIPLEFEPVRRDDFEFIYMIATPVQGRQLRPLFKFHDAGDVPVFAVGSIYNGRRETAEDQDLDGVVFPITAWQLDAVKDPPPELASLRDGTYGRLYALGRDAWSLLRWLPMLRKDPSMVYRGDSGSLSLRPDGYLSRQPAWARFSMGNPVPYRWPEQP